MCLYMHTCFFDTASGNSSARQLGLSPDHVTRDLLCDPMAPRTPWLQQLYTDHLGRSRCCRNGPPGGRAQSQEAGDAGCSPLPGAILPIKDLDRTRREGKESAGQRAKTGLAVPIEVCDKPSPIVNPQTA